MYGLRTSAEESSVGDPEEDTEAPNLRIFLTETDRYENTTRTRCKNLGEPGGLYITKIQCIRKVLTRKRGRVRAWGWNTPLRCDQARPAAGVGLSTLGSISSSVSSRNSP